MIVHTLSEWKALCKLFLREEYIAVDTETYAAVIPKHGADIYKGKKCKQALIKNRARIHTISVACSFGSFVIGSNKLSPEIDIPSSEIVKAMRPVMESPKVLKIMHNASYDVPMFRNHGVTTNNYICTLLMGAIQDANLLKGLKERAAKVGMYLHKIDTVKDINEFLEYADEDAIATLRLYEAYEFGAIISDAENCLVRPEKIAPMKLEKWQRYFVKKQEMPVLHVMLQAEHRGILIDRPYMKKLEEHTLQRRDEELMKVFSHSDRAFNVNSGKQLGEWLYGDLQLPVMHTTPKGDPSTDKKALYYLQDKHEAVKALMNYRSIDTLLKNYINSKSGIAAYTDANSVVHCSINTHQAVTGRFSVTSPALQTIPREGTVSNALGEGWSIRRGFIARPGYVLGALDFSQIELRLITVYADEKKMIEVLNDDGDLHQLTADLCGVSRQVAKACYHPDTEVLTRNGWKRIGEIDTNTEVIQATPNADYEVTLDWVKPTDVFRQPNPHDHLIHFQNEGMDLRVTPDHRMLKYGSTGKASAVEAQNFDGRCRGWVNAGFLDTGTLSENEQILRLAVATQADGNYNGLRIRFGFSKLRKIDRLRSLLEVGEYVEDSSTYPVTRFTLGRELSQKIKALLTDTKEIPWSWLNLSVEDREVVLDEVRYWDGSKQDNWKAYQYFSNSDQSIDVVQAIAALSSRKTYSRKHKNQNTKVLTIRENNHTRGENLSKTVIPYTGEVVCLTVPSSYVLVRDKGIVTVCGNCNFGLCYGMGPWKLSEYLTMNGIPTTETQAKVIYDAYHDAYPGIRKFHNACVAEHNARGYVTCLTGRRRHIPELNSSVKREVSAGRRTVVNNRIQASAGDLLKQAIIRIAENPETEKRDVHFLLQIHDELLFEFPEKGKEETLAYLKSQMEMLPTRLERPLTVPIVASGDCGLDWGSCK